MTTTQRNFLTFGALGALFLAGSFLQSRGSQARAAYATPVQVTNTSSAPAIGVDAEKLARIPYQSIQSTNTCNGNTGCYLQFTSPPAHTRLVIQHVSGFFWQAPGTTSPAGFYLDVGLNGTVFVPSQLIQGANGSVVFSMANQDALAYIDAGAGLSGFAEGTWLAGQPVTVAITGYLESCEITGCPAIQN